MRGGKRIDALEPTTSASSKRKTDSDDRIYDGELTAHALHQGRPPRRRHRLLLVARRREPAPRRTLRRRIRFQPPRPDAPHAPSPALAASRRCTGAARSRPASAARRERRLHLGDDATLPALDAEDSTPDLVRAVEIGAGDGVRARGTKSRSGRTRCFALDDALARRGRRRSPTTFRAQHPTRDAQIIAAIRFVQDDIRYLGIEMGRNSHEPHQPCGRRSSSAGATARTRRSCSRRSCASSASRRIRRSSTRDCGTGSTDNLPSPFLFDHVITEVVDGGKTYWVDGTISDQGGTLATIETPNDERALIVRPGRTALTTIVTQPERRDARRAALHHHELQRADARWRCSTTYSGDDADDDARRTSPASRSRTSRRSASTTLAVDQPKIEARRRAGDPRRPRAQRDRGDGALPHPRPLERRRSGRGIRACSSSISRRPDTMIRKMPLAFPGR